jgi:hypothetical protein
VPSKLADRPNDARGEDAFGLTENHLYERAEYSHGLKVVKKYLGGHLLKRAAISN